MARTALTVRDCVFGAEDRLVEEFVEVLGFGQRVAVEVGAESNHDGSDIFDRLLLAIGRRGRIGEQEQKREEGVPQSSSRLTKGS
jgi:hypothetical protein